MTTQISPSDWGKYNDLLQQLGGMQLDWSTWSNLTASIVQGNAGLWGAVPENAMYGYGLAELLGEIYQVQPTDVDLDDASQLKATDDHVLSMLWHVVNAQSATDLPGYDGWEGYFLCWEPDGSLTCATARDAEEWTPILAAEDDADSREAGEQPLAEDDTPAETVEGAVFATTAEAEDGAARVTDLVQKTLNQGVSELPADVLAALSPQDLESMAVEANKAVAAGS